MTDPTIGHAGIKYKVNYSIDRNVLIALAMFVLCSL